MHPPCDCQAVLADFQLEVVRAMPLSESQGVVKVFPELSNKNSARSGGFEIHDPTVTLKKESVQEIVGRNSANLDHGQVSECNSLDKVIALIVNNNASEGL